MKWRSVVFSDESRFCLYASDGRNVYGVDLVSVIFRSVFAHDTQAVPQASWSVGSSVTHLMFLQGKINSACYIAKVVNPVLMSFL